MSGTVKLILEGERPPSWNKAYAGQHWQDRRQQAAEVRRAVRAAMDPLPDTVFEVPVRITINAYFERYPLDADNIAAKLYIDALKSWYIADDDRWHVQSVTTGTYHGRPRVEIWIEPVRKESNIAAWAAETGAVVQVTDW